MATFNTEPKPVPMQAYQPLPLPSTVSSAGPPRSTADRVATIITYMVAWIGLFLTCYGVSALCLIKGYHPKIPLKQEKGVIVALVFGLVILLVIVPGSWYVRNKVRG